MYKLTALLFYNFQLQQNYNNRPRYTTFRLKPKRVRKNTLIYKLFKNLEPIRKSTTFQYLFISKYNAETTFSRM